MVTSISKVTAVVVGKKEIASTFPFVKFSDKRDFP